MQPYQVRSPVVFVLYNRPDHAARVFEGIRAARPARLLVIADGPHLSRPGDVAACARARAVVDCGVDWPCEVVRAYAPQNMGCKARVWSGLDWAFGLAEEAIILEDDCVPAPSFFRFCDDLLERYRHEPRVTSIAGTDLQLGRQITADSYHFARNAHVWGWATWRRAWRGYDGNLARWPELRRTDWLRRLLGDDAAAAWWARYFDLAHAGRTAWDVPWVFSAWLQDGVAAAPNVNLVRNIGFGAGASGDVSGLNPVFARLYGNLPAGELRFPLRHPSAIAPAAGADEFTLHTICSLDVAYLRRKMAEALSGDRMIDEHQARMALHVLNSGLRAVPPQESERLQAKQFIGEVRPPEHEGQTVTQNRFDGPHDPQAIQHLLAAMIYRRADQLPRLPAIDKMPGWFRDDYIRYLLEPPQLFTEPGEARAYAQYMAALVDHVCEAARAEPDLEATRQLAVHFAQTANFVAVYFNDLNLRELYRKRAEIMEFALRAMGHELDWNFPPRPPGRKIRLGVLAAHFSPQTETHTTLPAYKHLSRDRFEITLFTLQITGHRMERYCAAHADDVIQLQDDLPQMVAKIRAADLDVLWIGTNVTAVSNWVTLLAPFRLARVQVMSTSSCVTTGMSHVDYYVSGALCEPPGAQEQYSEKLVLLDGPAHCMDLGTEAKPVPTQVADRAALQLGSEGLVFTSGANFFKVLPEVERTWAAILAAVPNSRLMLYPFNPNWSDSYPTQPFIDRLHRTFAAQGVGPERVRVLEPVPNRADVKERLKLADVYLDSFPFSGVNSLLDPLEVGVPPVVMDGNSFRSLMAASLLRELKLPELIAADEEAYVRLAVALAGDAALRDAHRQRIQTAMAAGPKFLDTRWYCDRVEQLLLEWTR